MKNYGIVARLRAALSVVADGTNQIFRTNQLGEQISAPSGAIAFAIEGSTFVTSTPTPGTAVALGVAAATAFSATAPAILIRNTDSVGGKDLIVRRLRLTSVGVNTTATSLECAVVVDSINRYVSGGAARTPVNTRADSAVATISQFWDASVAIVASAATASSRYIGRMKLRTGVNVAGDCYSLAFGSEPTTETGALSGTVASLFALSMPALVIPPQGSALIYLWSPAQTVAPTYEYTVETVER